MTDNSPLLVASLSLMVMLKLKVSEATFHWTPSTLSIIGRLKSRFLTTVARSASGIDSTTFQEFDSHFVRQNPPLHRSSVRLSTRKIALYYHRLQTVINVEVTIHSAYSFGIKACFVILGCLLQSKIGTAQRGNSTK